MFEGMGQGGIGANWGDGHCTDPGLLANRVPPNANPISFYQQLVEAPYANNAIISTHVYPCDTAVPTLCKESEHVPPAPHLAHSCALSRPP